MENVKVGGFYRHFKGFIVKVSGIAINSETLEEMVLYTHDNKLWARPISSFLDKKDISSRIDNVTKQKYRFELIEKEN